jgi:hypothetical protein
LLQHCCNGTIDELFMWHHHNWTFAHYAVSMQSSLWSISCTLVWWPVNLDLFMQYHCNWIVWWLVHNLC